MNDRQLAGNLNNIGEKCFVTFFGKLCDLERSDEAVARCIAEDWGRSYSAALTWRVRPARKIIAAGRAKDALVICSKSRGLPRHIRDKAAVLAELPIKQIWILDEPTI